MAFVVSANEMEFKVLNAVVLIPALSFGKENFLGAALEQLLGSLGLVVDYPCLLCIEELKHVELFTYPVVVSCVPTLHVFFGVNFYDELDGAAVIQHVVLDQGFKASRVMPMTFGVHDFFVHLQVMEVIGSFELETKQCVVIVNAH